MLRRFLLNYARRHRHPANRAFHAVGLPVTFLLPPWLLASGQPLEAFAAFLVGYALQFAGHACEGNDAGEMVLVKRWLRLPYTAEIKPPETIKH